MNLGRIKSEFPAPSYRGYQEETLEGIRRAYENGSDVVLVRAPTGSGKSLLARAVAGCARRTSDGEGSLPTGAYYTTPQVSQIDDVESDSLLDDLALIRGKSNYNCIHPKASEPSVDRAPCARFDNFDCDHINECPYFVEKDEAQNTHIAATTLAYFFEQSPPRGSFEERDVLVVDEAHGLLDWAEMFGTVEVSQEIGDIWRRIQPPRLDSITDVANWAGHTMVALKEQKSELEKAAELSPDEAHQLSDLERLVQGLNWFLDEYHDDSTGTRWLYDQPEGKGGSVTIRPIDPERVLYHTLWERAEKHLLLSATLLNKKAFCRSVGLSPKNVSLVSVPHTFPVDHRPLFDVMQGKMTYEDRDETLPKVAQTIGRILQKHDAQKGLIHCHSYAIQDKLESMLYEIGFGRRIRSHSSDNRDLQLRRWIQSDRPDVFLSVKMEEALDLADDLCRWQVLCKVPYPNTNDPRVSARLENDQWAWYYRETLSTVIQACGRVVRSPDDYGATYLADSSFEDLFSRARFDMPEWFEDQVDRMTKCDLPPLQKTSTP